MPVDTIHSGARVLAFVLAAFSAAAMLYVGLYQSRAVQHLWCPVFGKGCEAVADAPFARPFGIPDGYIAAVLYGIVLILLLGPIKETSEPRAEGSGQALARPCSRSRYLLCFSCLPLTSRPLVR
jgi:uncharacterized membrane protein